MIRQPHTSPREIIIADAIKEVVSELRLVDVVDYIAFIRLEQFGCISDIVDSAAELFFYPGALRLGHGGEVHVGWTETPRVVLDLELRPAGATVYFALTLTALHASVEINYVSFDAPDSDPEKNTAFLADAVERTRIRRTAPLPS
ncbi:hypothetical protein C7441_10859 [Pseudaminobacter salicylatoxidans]|uniref:Uncharacterized protein n=1 Tax=Pseudaminobacter salicylatoxidans TaxID=93369 RepID=A0A316C6P2_PSESE|nr:hypothetical protein [Pseudaminobacter salicylatoxidans]PWJ83667.1 hypothetical protein C7441_10859 [Pseudaminobacter salicylatoxidans]